MNMSTALCAAATVGWAGLLAAGAALADPGFGPVRVDNWGYF